MTANDWISIVVVLICLLLSAFFAGSETALTASSRASMARLEKHGNRRATIVNRLLQQRERLLGALLFGNNAVNIAASALATGVLLTWFGNAGVVYATVVMTIVVVVFSEILPKTAAFNAPDRIALAVADHLHIYRNSKSGAGVTRMLICGKGTVIVHEDPLSLGPERSEYHLSRLGMGCPAT